MNGPSTPPLHAVARALRTGEESAEALLDRALARHHARRPALDAYKLLDEEGARSGARGADRALTAFRAGTGPEPGPFCGIPVSVKDLYGMDGLPTFAGTARRLPDRWSRDAWLVAALRAQGAVFVGKTHTVELAYAGVGINPHWGTPRNPWDDAVHRIPGGSSCGAGASLHEGSALLALGTDTGGSIRIPASFTGMVGMRLSTGRWPTDGVVPLSHTLDTVGGLTRSVADQAWFFGAVDPARRDPEALLARLAKERSPVVRIGVPRCAIMEACQDDIAVVMRQALDRLASGGAEAGSDRESPTRRNGPAFRRVDLDGTLLDAAAELYLTGAIAGAECRAFLEAELPDWPALLHPTVGDRLAAAPSTDSQTYRQAQRRRIEMAEAASALFQDVDVLVLPGHLMTPPPVADLADPAAYRAANVATLRPTAPASLLGLCAMTLPVGLDTAGMPVGLQLLAPGGADEALLAVGLAVEQALGTAGGPRRPPAE